jgi:hypothetical protein
MAVEIEDWSKLDAVKLADGWHIVVEGSFTPYWVPATGTTDAGTTAKWYRFDELDGGEQIGPMSAIVQYRFKP